MAMKINFTGSALEVLTCMDVKAYILGFNTEDQRLVYQRHPSGTKDQFGRCAGASGMLLRQLLYARDGCWFRRVARPFNVKAELGGNEHFVSD